MVIVGEKINGTSKRVREAVLARDEEFIRELARRQAEAGAHYLDVNSGTEMGRDADDMVWLVKTVQSEVETPLCIDSPNPQALEAGLEAHQGRALVNSATAEADRMDLVIGLARKHDARLVALTLDDQGMPSGAEERLTIAKRLAEAAVGAGMSLDDLFIDPLVRAVGVENDQGAAVLEAIGRIREALPEVHIICGLSNISFQMPQRRLLNRTFLAMAMGRGLDAAIMDPLDAGLMATVCAGEVLAGRDDMCMGYLQAYRAGKLEQ